jgi:hypothetical protein
MGCIYLISRLSNASIDGTFFSSLLLFGNKQLCILGIVLVSIVCGKLSFMSHENYV